MLLVKYESLVRYNWKLKEGFVSILVTLIITNML